MAKEKVKKLKEMTVKELQAEVVKLGMPEEDANSFQVKQPLIATIQVLRAKKLVETPAQLRKEKEQYLSKKERMMAILMKQPTVRILIPLSGKEKPGVIDWVYNEKTKRKEQVYRSGAYTPVQINGAKWMVPHGKYVPVPRQIAEMIETAQQATTEAGRDWLIDRDDPKTGKPIRDVLE